MEKDFAGPGVEVDSSSTLSSQIGCAHDEALLRQYLFRHFAVLGAHRWAGLRVPATGRTSAPPNNFISQFTPAGPERIKLPCQVTDTEVYVAVPFGIPGARRPG